MPGSGFKSIYALLGIAGALVDERNSDVLGFDFLSFGLGDCSWGSISYHRLAATSAAVRTPFHGKTAATNGTQLRTGRATSECQLNPKYPFRRTASLCAQFR